MRKQRLKPSTALILLCWIVYASSYLGKVNYSANINSIIEYYRVDHSAAGLASTFFFFAYGVGQFANGMLCKKYNLKWVVFASLAVSATINLVVGATDNFAVVLPLWLVNGFSMSVLWPSLIRLLSQSLPKKDMARASVVMGTTVAAGTLIIYAMSALFVSVDFKLAFYFATVALFGVAAIWIFSYSRVEAAALRESKPEEEKPSTTESNTRSNGQTDRALLLVIAVLCFYGVATNLIKDGLIGWVPSIMKEQYGIDASFSIILTLLLPIVSIFGNAFAVKMHRRVPDYVLQCALTFFASGAIIGTVIGGVSLRTFWITLVGFALVCFLVSSCNSLITSVFPLFMKGKLNSGFIAGILNGCSYIGSTVSSYGLGVIADGAGWIAVFWTLLGVCGAVCLGALLYLLIKKRIRS